MSKGTVYCDVAVKGEHADRKALALEAARIARKRHKGQWVVSDTRKGRGVFKGRVCFRLRQKK